MLGQTAIGQLIKNIEQLDESKIWLEVAPTMETIENSGDMVREQLLAGKDGDDDFLPRYVDDDYFKSLSHALAYEEWKSKISPNSSKPRDVMDLFITGDFHNTIGLEFINENGFNIGADFTMFGDDLERYSDNLTGLHEKNLEIIREEALPRYIEQIRFLLGQD
jgi:hypothetical protein